MGNSGTGAPKLSTAQRPSVHRRAVANLCVAFPDANIPLALIFDETEFSKKIEFFEQSIAKYNLRIEILPKTDDEVTNVINKNCELFAQTLNQIRAEIENSAKTKIDALSAEIKVLQQIEEAIDRTIVDLRNAIQNPKQREKLVRQTRVVENALVRKLYRALESGRQESMKNIFKEVQDDCEKAYTDYHDKYGEFRMRFRCPKPLKEEEIFNPLPKLWEVLKRCVPTNLNDVVLLVQGTCRMFQLNCWGAVVTADYTEIFHNRISIFNGTLLTVCDPLYLLHHLDNRIASNLTPQDEAKAKGLIFHLLVNFPAKPAQIV
jgi:hypothetical protein